MLEALNMALKGLNLLGVVLPIDKKEQEQAFFQDFAGKDNGEQSWRSAPS